MISLYHCVMNFRREYRRSQSRDEYDRESEVQRFYRGSSKERKHYNDNYHSESRRYDKFVLLCVYEFDA